MEFEFSGAPAPPRPCLPMRGARRAGPRTGKIGRARLAGRCAVVAVALALLPGPGSAAADWTRFRGPNGSGHGEAPLVPSQWTQENFLWRSSIPGVGHSSPVTWGENVYVTTADAAAGEFSVLAYSIQEGRERWRKSYPQPAYPKHNYNSFASSTPTVDGERLYMARFTAKRAFVTALDHAGQPAWEHDLGPFQTDHAGGTSPILHEGLVIIANEQDNAASIVALDAKTGAVRWTTPRQPSKAAYSTPCVWTPAGAKPALVFNSQSHGIFAVEPRLGEVLWEFDQAFDKRSVSSAVVASGLLLGSCGSGGGGNYVVAVQPGDPAKKEKPRLAWEVRRSAPYVPTPLPFRERIFLWSDAGIVSCVKAASGQVIWQERVGGDFFGSPVAADERIFCVSTRGEVVVVRAADQFEVLGRNRLEDLCHSTPAIAGGKMFIHTASSLVCIGAPADAAASR